RVHAAGPADGGLDVPDLLRLARGDADPGGDALPYRARRKADRFAAARAAGAARVILAITAAEKYVAAAYCVVFVVVLVYVLIIGLKLGRLERELAGDEGEAVCLSTCNRTELYVSGPGLEERAAEALAEAEGAVYRRSDDEAARHLFRVAAGLDSRVRGETEILGQVRAAYALGTPGPLLDRLFREALRVGRKVRTQAPVGDPAASAASAAAVLAERVLGDLTGRQVLLIGAGEIGEATAARLVARGARVAFVANRGEERRGRVARRLEAEPLALADIAAALGEADVVVASTNSRSFLVSRDDVERALATRERRPLLLIDLAVPRDLDPEIATLPYAFLYDVDDPDDAVGT